MPHIMCLLPHILCHTLQSSGGQRQHLLPSIVEDTPAETRERSALTVLFGRGARSHLPIARTPAADDLVCLYECVCVRVMFLNICFITHAKKSKQDAWKSDSDLETTFLRKVKSTSEAMCLQRHTRVTVDFQSFWLYLLALV